MNISTYLKKDRHCRVCTVSRAAAAHHGRRWGRNKQMRFPTDPLTCTAGNSWANSTGHSRSPPNLDGPTINTLSVIKTNFIYFENLGLNFNRLYKTIFNTINNNFNHYINDVKILHTVTKCWKCTISQLD